MIFVATLRLFFAPFAIRGSFLRLHGHRKFPLGELFNCDVEFVSPALNLKIVNILSSSGAGDFSTLLWIMLCRTGFGPD